jgi:hypothetical protein
MTRSETRMGWHFLEFVPKNALSHLKSPVAGAPASRGDGGQGAEGGVGAWGLALGVGGGGRESGPALW